MTFTEGSAWSHTQNSTLPLFEVPYLTIVEFKSKQSFYFPEVERLDYAIPFRTEKVRYFHLHSSKNFRICFISKSLFLWTIINCHVKYKLLQTRPVGFSRGSPPCPMCPWSVTHLRCSPNCSCRRKCIRIRKLLKLSWVLLKKNLFHMQCQGILQVYYLPTYLKLQCTTYICPVSISNGRGSSAEVASRFLSDNLETT